MDKEDEDKTFALVVTPESVYKSDITDLSKPFVNTFLAIRNKRTNKIRLVQVQEASFRHTLYDDTYTMFENNIVDAKKVLHKEFGGKKAAASYDRVKKTAPNIDVLEETLETQLNAIEDKMFEKDIFDQSQEIRQKLQNSIFPDIDLSGGKSVRDVFNPKKLLGEEMMEHLEEIAVQVLQRDPKQLGFVNNYLNSTVQSLQLTKQPDSKENLTRVAMFVYIDSLIRTLSSKKRSLVPSEVSVFSEQVGRDVCKRFSMGGNFTNSKFTRQKSIIYYLVLLLVSSENLQIALEFALDGIYTTKTELLKYGDVIGAKIKNGDTLYIQKAKLDSDSKISAPMPSGKRRGRK